MSSDEQMQAPEISDKTNLSFSEAKTEYRKLVSIRDNAPKFGWVRHIQIRLADRMNYLRKTITDYVIKE